MILASKRASNPPNLAQKIVAELNREIKDESPVGQGTTFHVRLPVVHVRLADADKTNAPG